MMARNVEIWEERDKVHSWWSAVDISQWGISVVACSWVEALGSKYLSKIRAEYLGTELPQIYGMMEGSTSEVI